MRVLLVAITSLLIAIAAGCGGDDGGGEGVSREEFIAQADEICERINAQIEEVNEMEATDLASLQQVLDRGLEVSRQGLEDFEELEPPEEIEGEVETFLDASREQIEALENAREAESIEDAAQVLQEDIPAIVERRREVAGEIGFEECGAGN